MDSERKVFADTFGAAPAAALAPPPRAPAAEEPAAVEPARVPAAPNKEPLGDNIELF